MCINNRLVSLEFSPKEIQGNFYCGNNELTTLEFCPNEVVGDFSYSNKLTSLEGCVVVLGLFNCSNNNSQNHIFLTKLLQLIYLEYTGNHP